MRCTAGNCTAATAAATAKACGMRRAACLLCLVTSCAGQEQAVRLSTCAGPQSSVSHVIMLVGAAVCTATTGVHRKAAACQARCKPLLGSLLHESRLLAMTTRCPLSPSESSLRAMQPAPTLAVSLFSRVGWSSSRDDSGGREMEVLVGCLVRVLVWPLGAAVSLTQHHPGVQLASRALASPPGRGGKPAPTYPPNVPHCLFLLLPAFVLLCNRWHCPACLPKPAGVDRQVCALQAAPIGEAHSGQCLLSEYALVVKVSAQKSRVLPSPAR